MTQYFVEVSKYRAETIPISVDFSDDLASGETITGSPVILVDVYTGADPDPSSILFNAATIAGNIVTQNVRLGLEGVIYDITFSVTTNLGNVFEHDCVLAILPLDSAAIPTWGQLWETSYPYPYYWYDDITTTVTIAGGSTLYNPSWTESMASTVAMQNALLYGGSVPYSNPHEDLVSSIAMQSGVLYGGVQTYVYSESLDSHVAIISGTIYSGAISYANPHEDLTATVSIQSGLLST